MPVRGTIFIFTATGRFASMLELLILSPVRGLTSSGKSSGPKPSSGYGGVGEGDGVVVAVSVGGIGVGVFVGVAVANGILVSWAVTSSVGLGPHKEQAVSIHPKMINMINFFILVILNMFEINGESYLKWLSLPTLLVFSSL